MFDSAAASTAGVRGIDAYRATWPPFFEWQAPGAELQRYVALDVTVPAYDVAFLRTRC